MQKHRNELVLKLRAFAIPRVSAWLRRQRERYRADPRAVALDSENRHELAPYFSDEVLDRARFVTLKTARADRPSFFEDLRAFGISESLLTSFTDVAAITYQDVVIMPTLFPVAANLPLIFHELIHVLQFDELGLEGFTQRYVDGWLLAGGRYEGIPLEIDAYALQECFVLAPDQPFDAKKEVQRRLLGAAESDAGR